MDLYDVIFEGKILPGKNINAVKAEFAKLFKVSSEEKLNSFFSGHPVVLKKVISLEQAEPSDYGTTDDAVVEEVAAIEFEYGAVEGLETLSNDDEVVEPEQEDEKSEPVSSVSLADLSLVELEEKDPEDEGDE
jgi:hypothetical protein